MLACPGLVQNRTSFVYVFDPSKNINCSGSQPAEGPGHLSTFLQVSIISQVPIIGILCNGLVYRVYEVRPDDEEEKIYQSRRFDIPLKANMGWGDARDAVKDVLSRILQILLTQIDAYNDVMP